MNEQKSMDWAVVFNERYEECGRLAADRNVYDNICNAINEGHNGCICYMMRPSTILYLQSENFKIEEDFMNDCKYWIVSWQQEVII